MYLKVCYVLMVATFCAALWENIPLFAVLLVISLAYVTFGKGV